MDNPSFQTNDSGQMNSSIFNVVIDSLPYSFTEIGIHQFMDFIPAGIFIHENGIIRYVNQVGVKLLQAPNKEILIGKSILELLYGEQDKTGDQRLKKLECGETIPFIRCDVKCFNGEVAHFEFNTTLICHEQQKCMVTVLRDISIEKMQETELYHKEQQYKLITENMSELIGIFDQNGIIQYASPSYEIVMGYTPDFYIGKNALDMIHDDDKAYIVNRYEQLLKTGEPQRVEFRYQHRDGHFVWLEVIGKVLTKSGDRTDYMVVGREITERKESEALIRKLDKLSAVGQLAAGVGHEIRNPLTSIKGFLQLMKQEPLKYNDNFYWDIIFKELTRIDTIVNEFMFLAKPQTGTMKQINLNQIVKSTLTLLDSQANLHNATLSQSFNRDQILTNGIEDHLRQVLINLLVNSIESIDGTGGVRVKVELLENSIRIRIIDNGKGISKEHLDKLGTPFYTTKEKGIGLGLAISQKIVNSHHGELLIRSKVGFGSLVDIVLPTMNA
ncbi:PAS domain S-box-containing protein [Bacillus oleivorans]|uniref:histidine kinase n=1 Tax=Bacillus oleivorans TaxID=1448271 RepID=A0A285CZA1_9BACI|nr:PAS domain S-box-containing protein [Bacillus oleivorans]